MILRNYVTRRDVDRQTETHTNKVLQLVYKLVVHSSDMSFYSTENIPYVL